MMSKQTPFQSELTEIQQPVAYELGLFRQMYRNALTSADGLLQQALQHLLQRTGKGMRPTLTLLMAKAYGGVTDATLHGACALELLHTASLLHDDVVDESAERRGQASVNAAYTNKIAVLVGDFLLSKALEEISKTGSHVLTMRLGHVGRVLSEGELEQIEASQGTDMTSETYFSVISKKTGELFAACVDLGRLSAKQEASEQQKLDAALETAATDFGRRVGMMFQVKDDLLDFIGENDVGKPVGQDLSEGKLTLPVLMALKGADGDVQQLALRVKHEEASADEIATLHDYALQHDGVALADAALAAMRAESADFIAENVKDAEISRALTRYIDYIINRKL